MSYPSARTLQVVVGGVNVYADLAVASNFTDGVSTGRLGLYTHGNGVIDQGQHGVNYAVGQAWGAEGPGVAEFGLYGGNFFATSYPAFWTANGLGVAEADVDVNFGDPQFLSKFDAFVSAGRSVAHIQNFAPIFSPNSSALYNGSQASLGTGFFDPKWAAIRAAAVFGGGIALDTPPLFVKWSPPWYLSFVEQEIRWGNMMGLRTSVIVSPYVSGPDFLSQAQTFEKQLVADHAVPSQWVVETYAQNPDGTYPNDSNYANPIGAETTPNTVANVADWFAHNAPTAVAGPAAGSWRIQNADGSFGDTFAGSWYGGSLVDKSATGETVYTYAANGAQTGSRFVAAAPVVAHPTADQHVAAGAPLSFGLAAGTFVNPIGGALTVSARMADGSALPSWLQFDPSHMAFSGTAPPSAETAAVSVTAANDSGGTASDIFRIAVLPAAPTFIGAAAAGQAPTQSFGLDQAFSLSVDQEPAAVHMLRVARQASLSALPSWIGFDAATGVLSGETPATHGSLSVRVDEAPPGGGMTTEMFRIAY